LDSRKDGIEENYGKDDDEAMTFTNKQASSSTNRVEQAVSFA
jgi:hypothetical protein